MFNTIGEIDTKITPGSQWVIQSVTSGHRLDWHNHMPNVVSMETAEERIRGEDVHSILIDTDAPSAEEAIPGFIRNLPTLKVLHLPSQIAPSLTPDLLPASLKELIFSGRNDKKYWNNKTVIFSGKTPFRGIESLTGTTYCFRSEARFRFAPELFPDLRAISFTFDKDRKFSETLRQLSNLVYVNAACFDTVDQLADLLPAANIVSLTLGWNKQIERLTGIERFPNLRYLKLTSMTKLRTLEELLPLQHLEFLGVYYSKCIEDAGALRALPRLRQIDVWVSDNRQTDWVALSRQVKTQFNP